MSYWTRKEIVECLRMPDPAPLFAEADSVLSNIYGRNVHLRALLETGNNCVADCLYCGLRRGNTAAERYSMDAPTIVDTATRAAAGGFRTVVMQAGEDAGMRPEFLRDVVASIRRRADAAITLSYGEWPASVYRMWQQAGADRYLLKFETSNRELFASLRPGRTLAQRLSCLHHLGAAGYQVGTGFMVGLPGQTLEDLAGDLLLLYELHPAMAGIGPYIPHPSTPLGRQDGPGGAPGWREDPVVGHVDSGDMALRCIAVARVMNPVAHLPATTALGVRMDKGYLRGLAAGANVIMVDVTPGRWGRLYEIYPGRRMEKDATPSSLWNRYRKLLARAGYAVSTCRGDGLRIAPRLQEPCTA